MAVDHVSEYHLEQSRKAEFLRKISCHVLIFEISFKLRMETIEKFAQVA